jgi:large repetitive protein
MKKFHLSVGCAAALIGTVVVGCGGGGGSIDAPLDGDALDAGASDSGTKDTTAKSFAVGGTVTGLLGTGMVLQNNGADDITVNANGTFVFSTKVVSGRPFAVTVKNQPTAPSQTCTVSGATGTVATANVTTVVVKCATATFTVGGTVTGLAGAGLVLQNGTDEITIGDNGSFAFPKAVASETAYAVTVKAQPTNLSQTCTVTNGDGKVAAADVKSVAVACVTSKFTVGGTVTGMVGSGLVLQNNGAGDLAVAEDGTFTFAAPQDDGSAFAVTVLADPTDPEQTCLVTGGTGELAGGNVSSVTVNCSTKKYAVGGTITGLAGTGLVLQNNAGDDLPVNANGTFAFATPIEDLAAYAVTVKTDPTNAWQTCTVTSGSGNVAQAAITDVSVTCTTNTYAVGGTISGLDGSGLVLQNSAGDDLAISENGAFTFPTAVASGSGYLVSVKTQPSDKSQTCTVTSGTGTMAGADVTNVSVACVTNKYTVGGSVTGIADGNRVVLQNDGGDDLTVDDNGGFAFQTAIESGTSYAVTVKTQPTSPNQTCVVTGGTGTVAAGNVETVSVNCTTNTYTAGGTVSGLDGTGLVLTSNGADLAVNANGSFAFPAQADGTGYAVTVKTQPTAKSQTCTVTSGTGTIAGANVTSVEVACVTNTYTVGGTVSGLTASGLVLTNNGGNDLAVASGATSFTFTTSLASGSAYAVAVKTPPPEHVCAVSDGSGTVVNGDVSGVKVTCTTFTNASFEDDWAGWTLTRTNSPTYNGATIRTSGTTLATGDSVHDYISNASHTITYTSSALPATHTALSEGDGTKIGLLFVSNGSSEVRATRDVLIPTGAKKLSVNTQYSSGAALHATQTASVQLLNTSTSAVLGTVWQVTTGSPQSAPMATRSFDVSALAGTTVRVQLRVDATSYPLYAAFDQFTIE